MTADWSLRDHARHMVEQSPIADPHLLSRKVALTIPDEHLRDAVNEMIGAFVVNLVTRSRWGATDHTTGGHFAADTQVAAALGGDDLPGGDHSESGAHPEHVPAGRSKWPAVAAVYKRILDERIHDGDGWKFFRDFTADNCRTAAANRIDSAARLVARSQQLDATADALIEHDVPTVGDLPDDVLKELFG